jgi:Zn-dependent metalloprotease
VFNKGAKMKKISIALIAALFVGILLVSLILAADSSKQNNEKTANINNKKAQPKEATKAEPVVANYREGGRPEYRGEIGGDRVEDSYRFFEIYKDSYGLINPRQELKLEGEQKDSLIEAVFFYQVVNGVKVASEIKAYFKPDGLLDCVLGQIDTNARKVDTNPTISDEQARQIAADDTKKRGTTLEQAKTVELMIGRFDGICRLVWDINVLRLDSILIDSDYFIDAKTGAILENATRMRD